MLAAGGEYIFLQQQDDAIWGVPGGKVEKNESPLKAVIREFFEETGILLKEDSVGHIKTVYISDPRKDFIFHAFVYTFKAKPKIVLNEREHQAYTWRTLLESLEMPLIWGEKEIFERYIENHVSNLTREYLAYLKQAMIIKTDDYGCASLYE